MPILPLEKCSSAIAKSKINKFAVKFARSRKEIQPRSIIKQNGTRNSSKLLKVATKTGFIRFSLSLQS